MPTLPQMPQTAMPSSRSETTVWTGRSTPATARFLLETGRGDDTIDASAVTDNWDLDIDGGWGNDTITGGAGDDRIKGGFGDDTIDAGAGTDYIDGGIGDDRISGGDGNDTVYGGHGKDTIFGDDGKDYIDGGLGEDVIYGGDGDDFISGGRGDDRIFGQAGNDVMAGGLGADKIYDNTTTDEGGPATDTDPNTSDVVYHDGDDEIFGVDIANQHHQPIDPNAGSSVTVEGSPEFRRRTDADLDTLAAIPSGAALLTSLDGSGRTTTIRETDAGNTANSDRDRPTTGADAQPWTDRNEVSPGVAGPGTDAEVNYNPENVDIGNRRWNERPPIVGLTHELIHAEDFTNGTTPQGHSEAHDAAGNPRTTVAAAGNVVPITTPDLEQSAVGLPYDPNNTDPDPLNASDSSTQVVDGRDTTENGFRAEIGWGRRDFY